MLYEGTPLTIELPTHEDPSHVAALHGGEEGRPLTHQGPLGHCRPAHVFIQTD